MSRTNVGLCVFLLVICCLAPMTAQQPVAASATSSAATVPPLVSFSGVLTDQNGKPLSGVVGVTFALYQEPQGGSPLWLETQNVYPSKTGQYTVLLGATTSTGLPSDLFVSGEARWLGVQVQGQAEQPRVSLLSVPYALKAGDAQTVGGLPPSAFVMANPTTSTASSPRAASAHSATSNNSKSQSPATETQNYIPFFTDASGDLGNSILYESGGTEIGIGTTAPSATLEVNGTAKFDGLATFATGQTFPGTLTGVTAGTGISITGSKTAPTININTTVANQLYAQLKAANTFTKSQTVNGNLSATGVVTGSSYQIGSNLFAFGSYANYNAFLGFAGNTTMTGGGNTAAGYQALAANTTGYNNTASGYGTLQANTTGTFNTASGYLALSSNTTGFENTASGSSALTSNTTGSYNTASGLWSLYYNATGSDNTALGYNAGPDKNSTALTNSTAIGANAVVSQSNALVLGCVNGVNSCPAAVNVGIGTATPAYTLDVQGSGRFTQPIVFASGQTFPGAGTVTGVTAGTDLTGGGTSGNVTLNVDTTKIVTGVTAGTALTGGGTGGNVTLNLDTTQVPQLAANNVFTGNQTVNGNLSATGVVTGSGYQIGSNLFALGSYTNANAFLGFAGNPSMAGTGNTGSGYQALYSNTTGFYNTASGTAALYQNTIGDGNTADGTNALTANIGGNSNTANGYEALLANTTGNENTATGQGALSASTSAGANTANGVLALGLDTTGSGNTAIGGWALLDNTTGSQNTAGGLNAGWTQDGSRITGSNNTFLGNSANLSTGTLSNATALGAFAVAGENNALVLGCVNGVNNCPAAVNVGIGTATPAYALDVHGTGNFTGLVNFASGQTFPGTGTITGVTAGTGLSGGGTSGSVTLNNTGILGVTAGTGISSSGGQTPTIGINTSVVPQLNAANTFTGNQTVNGNLSASNVSSAGVYMLGTALFAFGSLPGYNTGVGFGGNLYMTGVDNTADGYNALGGNNAGSYNTAAGVAALEYNAGNDNTANGYEALYGSYYTQNPSTGSDNTADGYQALYSYITGSYNTASGYMALYANTTGSSNTASGSYALNNNSTGVGNVAVGYYAGTNITTGSNNIDISNYGVYTDSGVIRIGTPGIQAATYIGGIYGANLGSGNAVYVNSVGQLGVLSSSRRFKQDIRDLGDTTKQVMGLRPVRFRYKTQGPEGPDQYGLIAEEVNEVAPDLVGRGQDGRIDFVRYDKVNILLLSEVQKQHRVIQAQKRKLQAQIREQQQQIRSQEQKIRAQQAQIKAQQQRSELQEAEMAKLMSQVRAIQAALKTNGRSDSEVRTVRTEIPVLQP